MLVELPKPHSLCPKSAYFSHHFGAIPCYLARKEVEPVGAKGVGVEKSQEVSSASKSGRIREFAS